MGAKFCPRAAGTDHARARKPGSRQRPQQLLRAAQFPKLRLNPASPQPCGVRSSLATKREMSRCHTERHSNKISTTDQLPFLDITVSPSTRISIRVRRKQSSASSGWQTTGSFSLNDVLSSIGTPVRS
jgi:hypothetical protein